MSSDEFYSCSEGEDSPPELTPADLAYALRPPLRLIVEGDRAVVGQCKRKFPCTRVIHDATEIQLE